MKRRKGTAERPRSEAERRELAARAEALGLSTVHTSSRQEPGTVRIARGGCLVILKGRGRAPRHDKKRGRVEGFSRSSRRRLLSYLQSIDQDQAGLPQFVTLTYPREWPGDPKRWKRDLGAWLQRLRRAHPSAWGVWRLEPQRRGAPHYHLLLFGCEGLCKHWLSRSWYDVVGSGDPRHLRAGTQRQRARTWRGVVNYASKYLAKQVDELPAGWDKGVGRWWGKQNAKLAPRCPMEVRPTEAQFYDYRRCLRRLVFGPPSRAKRFYLGRGARWSSWHSDRCELMFRGLHGFVKHEDALRLLEWARRERS